MTLYNGGCRDRKRFPPPHLIRKKLFHRSRRCRQRVSTKRRYMCTRLLGVTSEVAPTVSAVKTSDVTTVLRSSHVCVTEE